MTQPIFKIQNLKCEYIPNSPVLELRKLDIPRGKLIFVIGKSGIGKSTFIETLGLMNKTIALSGNTSIQFFPGHGKEYIELKDSWALPNQEISDFRKNYFTFIFQNTNLMPNFSAGENMIMSLLIKGKGIVEAKKMVLRVMDRLSLGSNVFDKKITELSGGQRQRLAFVRAVTADFTVLFGDEPTGNLDENTAKELMGILKELIREGDKTGIIVSHDLMLAQRFADLVIPITISANNGNGKGEIISSKIIWRNEDFWQDGNGNLITNATEYLNHFLSKETSENE